MRSTRGMFGGQVVFKRRAGKSFVSAPPEVDENRVPTAGQLAIQKRFTASAAYANAAVTDPEMYNAYLKKAKRGQSPNNVAFKDAFTAPEVTSIVSTGYAGQPGNPIIIEATDDFKVASVKVAIHNAANELVEEGAAAATASGLSWIYTATQANAALAGSTITATAVDLPGNEGALVAAL